MIICKGKPHIFLASFRTNRGINTSLSSSDSEESILPSIGRSTSRITYASSSSRKERRYSKHGPINSRMPRMLGIAGPYRLIAVVRPRRNHLDVYRASSGIEADFNASFRIRFVFLRLVGLEIDTPAEYRNRIIGQNTRTGGNFATD